ncbi:Non-catalytic module family DOC2, partial [Piromyces sp. E2]
GYTCCDENLNVVYAHDENGDWSYDFKKMVWCGLTPYIEPEKGECWSEKLGYPCCKSCSVYETDENGKWGYENKQWCGV